MSALERRRTLDFAGRGLRAAFTLGALALAILLAVLAVVQVRSFVQGLTPQTGTRTIDRSGPVVLQSVRDLAKYDAAAGSYQVVVDIEQDVGIFPTTIVGQRTLFVALGTVDAFVDFSKLGSDAVTVSADRKSVELRLPRAALDKPNLDNQHSYVFAEQSGIVDRVRAFFAQQPDQQQKLYQAAERKIGDAAAQSHLTDRAETNARAMLQDLLRSLGYTQITITFG
jgi:hypothetical protein